MNRFLHILSGLSILATAAFCASSCSMMEDDVADCPAGLYVRFTYDYNTARADLFRDHAGHVKLYVYDENGNKVAEKSVSNTADEQPLRQYGYAIHFGQGELPEGRYRLQAIAMQKDWDDALATPGAKYRHNNPSQADELSVELDHSDDAIPGTEHFAVSAEAPLDTLWHTLKVTSLDPQDGIDIPAPASTVKPYSIYPLEEQYVTIVNDRATYATVSLIRNTNHINITLRQIDDPDNIFHDDFEVYITDANKSVGHDNEINSDVKLRYTPYYSWTTRFGEDGVDIETGSRADAATSDLQRTAHYNLMCNRLMYNSDIASSAILKIVNRHSGKTVAEVNLPYMLAEGRTAYSTYAYSPQEYLDREYDYHLNFFLRGDSWAYCDIVIDVLGWSKRTQNVSL